MRGRKNVLVVYPVTPPRQRVLATFCMNTIHRVIALVSNVLFMAYGYADQLYPVLLLHAILLPVNALRLLQFFCWCARCVKRRAKTISEPCCRI